MSKHIIICYEIKLKKKRTLEGTYMREHISLRHIDNKVFFSFSFIRFSSMRVHECKYARNQREKYINFGCTYFFCQKQYAHRHIQANTRIFHNILKKNNKARAMGNENACVYLHFRQIYTHARDDLWRLLTSYIPTNTSAFFCFYYFWHFLFIKKK